MTVYFVMFLVPALFSFLVKPRYHRNSDGSIDGKITGAWILVWFSLTILIGFRFEVGGDWHSYLSHINDMASVEFWNVFTRVEFSHWLINKIMLNLGLGITGVNVLYAFIFSGGLVAFASAQPRPWLVLACAIPYLVIVVGMGYSRQAVAIGFIFIAFLNLRIGHNMRSLIFLLIGATFHSSVIVLLPLAALVINRNSNIVIAIVLLIFFVTFKETILSRFSALYEVYIEKQITHSSGATIRLSMNALAGLTFLYFRRSFSLNKLERRLWTVVSLASIAMIVGLFLTNYSTAFDRIGIYLMPLQLLIAGHLPGVLSISASQRAFVIFLMVFLYFLVQFVWLNYANNAQSWLPFQLRIVK